MSSRASGNAGAVSDHMDGHRYYTAETIDKIIQTVPGGLPAGPVNIQQAAPDGSGLADCEVDRKTALATKLEAAAVYYLVERHFDEAPTPSELAKRFQSIETAAKKLLEALQIPHGATDEIPSSILHPLRRQAELMGARLGGFKHFPPRQWQVEGGRTHTDYMGPAALQDAVEGVGFLKEWAAEAKNRVQPKILPRGKNNGDGPTQRIFGELVGIWIEIFERPVKTTVGAPGTSSESKAKGPMINFIRACLEPLGLEMTSDAIRERLRPYQGMVKSRKRKI